VAQLLGVHGQWQPLQEIFGNLERRQALGGWWNAKAKGKGWGWDMVSK